MAIDTLQRRFSLAPGNLYQLRPCPETDGEVGTDDRLMIIGAYAKVEGVSDPQTPPTAFASLTDATRIA